MSMPRADAVFEGGGVKGIGLAGALLAAEELGYRWVNVAGTSAGAMIASLIAVGYTGMEIKEMIMDTDYSSFNDRSSLGNIPKIGAVASIIFTKGLYRGDSIEEWLREKYNARGKKKFKDLRTVYEDERYKYRLRVIASDITEKRLLVLPQDIARYGMDPDELDIARAVRMSISIPFFFEPVTLNYKVSNKRYKSLIVDGGILSNFPVWLFDQKGVPPWPTFGFKLVEPDYNHRQGDMNAVQYLLSIVSTMMEAFDERYIEASNFDRTIAIPTMGVGAAEFNISREKSAMLFESGYNAAKKFFKKWNFSRYIEVYRASNTAISI